MLCKNFNAASYFDLETGGSECSECFSAATTVTSCDLVDCPGSQDGFAAQGSNAAFGMFLGPRSSQIVVLPARILEGYWDIQFSIRRTKMAFVGGIRRSFRLERNLAGDRCRCFRWWIHQHL